MTSFLRHHTVRQGLIALCLFTALCACTNRRTVQEAGPVRSSSKATDPMADFARMIGAWCVTFTGGTSALHSWQWGPGRHSMRKVVVDTGRVWMEEVMYWHPGRKKVCVLSMHGEIPGIGRGMGEGTIKIDGEGTDAAIDLYQPRGLRKMSVRQAFEGPDKYHEKLLEDSGRGFQPLAEWDFFRVQDRAGERARTTAQEPVTLSAHLKGFEPLVGGAWESVGDRTFGEAVRVRSTYEWVPSLEIIRVRALAVGEDGEPVHEFEAYLYHHVRIDSTRCLALSSEGGVYEGEVAMLEGGGVQLDLKGYERDRTMQRMVRISVDTDGTVHNRVWCLNGAERRLLLDIRQKRVGLNKD